MEFYFLIGGFLFMGYAFVKIYIEKNMLKKEIEHMKSGKLFENKS